MRYRKNEAFVDVIETVNLLMSSKGTVLRSDVDGQIIMRAYLSGMPECKFGLNDKLVLDRRQANKNNTNGSNAAGSLTAATAGLNTDEQAAVELDDCQFHQCVRLGKFDSDRTISFVPPDGEFELMRYRSTTNVNLPFKVQPLVEEVGKSRVEYTISLRSNFDAKLNATNVTLKIPTPLNTASVDCKVTVGKAKYVPAENYILWKSVPSLESCESTLSHTYFFSESLAFKAQAKPFSQPLHHSRPQHTGNHGLARPLMSTSKS